MDKTISINPDLFKIGGRSGRRKSTETRKTKKRQVERENLKTDSALKKQFLTKIKDHAKRERAAAATTEAVSANVARHGNELGQHLDFLEDVVKREKTKKNRKKVGFQTPDSVTTVATAPSATAPSAVAAMTITTPVAPPAVAPPPTVSPAPPATAPPAPPAVTPPAVTPPATAPPAVTPPATAPPAVTPPTPAVPASPHIPVLLEPPPYSNLKNSGSGRPTFRQFHNKTLKNRATVGTPDVTQATPTASPKKQRGYVKTKHSLGKRGNGISILVKNNKTRKRVRNEVRDLRKKPIHEIKRFLKEKNMLKSGSMAPNDVLRKLYEDLHLAGEVTNENGDNLLHNFVNKDDA